MKKIVLFLALFGAFGLSITAQTEKRIEEIKKIYQETSGKIKECEQNGEYSSTFLSELVVNKNNGSYPAVGIFQTVFKFYYTYGDRENESVSESFNENCYRNKTLGKHGKARISFQ